MLIHTSQSSRVDANQSKGDHTGPKEVSQSVHVAQGYSQNLKGTETREHEEVQQSEKRPKKEVEVHCNLNICIVFEWNESHGSQKLDNKKQNLSNEHPVPQMFWK